LQYLYTTDTKSICFPTFIKVSLLEALLHSLENATKCPGDSFMSYNSFMSSGNGFITDNNIEIQNLGLGL
jgi:hypothetical protein